MRFGTGTISCLLLAANLAAPADAATYLITYTGTVSDGTDFAGQFGAPGRDLAGLAFTSVYTLTIPVPLGVHHDDGESSWYYGGPISTGGPSPQTASLKLDGTTVYMGASFGQSYQFYSGSYQQIDNFSEDYDYLGLSGNTESHHYKYTYTGIQAFNGELLTSPAFPQIFTYTVDPFSQNGYGGYFDYIQTYDYDTDTYSNDFSALVLFTTSTVSVARIDTPTVPEPATWAMLIAGFGLVGATLRRRTAQGPQRQRA